ncbi:MAG: TOBE domain-containing protein, partial [Alphaproteobacteria bacterium]|nr:TOBE domain-containing protein [Alphaproteobacteria bacterium]
DGDGVILCLRQQGVRVRDDLTSEGLSARVLHVKFLGDDAWLDVGVEGFDEPLRVRVLNENAFEKGTEVKVQIDLAKALVFQRPMGEVG